MRGLVVAAFAGAAAAATAPVVVFSTPFMQRTGQLNNQRGIFSRHRRNNLFGIIPNHHPPLSSATHVEGRETPSSSVTDRHGNGLERYLSIRGGYDEDIAEIAEWESCTAYSTVGIINLLPPDDREDVGNSLARRLEEKLLPSSSQVDDDAGPKLICLPSVGESSALVGTFGGNLDESASDTTLASYETIGTVSDAIYVLVKEGGDKDNETAISGIASVFKGLARSMGEHSNNGSKPRLVIYIQTPRADHQGSVRYLLRSALAKLREGHSALKWDSIPTLQRDVDIVALPYTAENISEMATTGKMFASHVQNDSQKAVPLSSFETLATQVYHTLSGGVAAGVEFHAVSSVSGTVVETDMVELTDSEAFAESGALSEMDDINYDDVSSELESEGHAEYDGVSIEVDSVDGADPVPLDAPKGTAQSSPLDPKMLLAELTGASRRILLECERKMGDLEAKQDEFLLNSDQGMPILEFGGDAQAIIDYASASFDEIAADATGTADIDDSIQAQIQGEKDMAGVFFLPMELSIHLYSHHIPSSSICH